MSKLISGAIIDVEIIASDLEYVKISASASDAHTGSSEDTDDVDIPTFYRLVLYDALTLHDDLIL